MQASPNPDDERDLRTMVVADHGVDPSPVPRHKAPTRQTAGMGLRDTLIWCGIPVLVILLLRVFVFGMYAIPSGSMENTIMPGDRVLTLSLAPKAVDLRRGDTRLRPAGAGGSGRCRRFQDADGATPRDAVRTVAGVVCGERGRTGQQQ